MGAVVDTEVVEYLYESLLAQSVFVVDGWVVISSEEGVGGLAYDGVVLFGGDVLSEVADVTTGGSEEGEDDIGVYGANSAVSDNGYGGVAFWGC